MTHVITQMALGGAVTYWKSAARSDAARLRQGLTSNGYETLVPEERTPLSALKDAIGDTLSHKAGLMVRPLSTKDGYDLVEEKKGNEVNTYTHVATLKYDSSEGVVLTDNTDDGINQDVLALIRQTYDHNMTLCTGAQVTALLLALVNKLGGITLRPSGAVYWIPLHNLDEWQSLARLVELAAVRGETAVHVLTVTMDASAQRAVIDGITTEIGAASALLMSELQDTELSKLQLGRRQKQIATMTEKVAQYEQALGASLDGLRDQLEELRTAQAFSKLVEVSV